MQIVRRNLRMAISYRETNPTEVAREAELGVNVVNSFLNGSTSISHANLLAVCDVLNIPIVALEHPDGITPARIRFFNLLSKLPDHLAEKASAIVQEELDQAGDRPEKGY